MRACATTTATVCVCAKCANRIRWIQLCKVWIQFEQWFICQMEKRKETKRKDCGEFTAHYNMDDMVWDRHNPLIRVARIGQNHWTKSMVLSSSSFSCSIVNVCIQHHGLGRMNDVHKAIDFLFFFLIWLDFALLCFALLSLACFSLFFYSRLMTRFFISFPFIQRMVSLCSFFDSYIIQTYFSLQQYMTLGAVWFGWRCCSHSMDLDGFFEVVWYAFISQRIEF